MSDLERVNVGGLPYGITVLTRVAGIGYLFKTCQESGKNLDFIVMKGKTLSYTKSV